MARAKGKKRPSRKDQLPRELYDWCKPHPRVKNWADWAKKDTEVSLKLLDEGRVRDEKATRDLVERWYTDPIFRLELKLKRKLTWSEKIEAYAKNYWNKLKDFYERKRNRTSSRIN